MQLWMRGGETGKRACHAPSLCKRLLSCKNVLTCRTAPEPCARSTYKFSQNLVATGEVCG